MKQFAVIGIGRFGYSVVRTLVQHGYQVLAIDINEEAIKDVEDIATQAVVLDATDEKSLKAIGINDVDIAVVAIGRDKEASILATLLLKEMGIKEVVTKATSTLHGKVLSKIGASRVVFPEGDMGERLANTLVSPSLLETIELSDKYGIFEIAVPKDFNNKSLGDINFRSRYKLNLIAIKREESEGNFSINISPMAGDVLKQKDIMVIIGGIDDFEKFKNQIKI